MKHAGTRRENTVPRILHIARQHWGEILIMHLQSETQVRFISVEFTFSLRLFLMKKFDGSLTKKKKKEKEKKAGENSRIKEHRERIKRSGPRHV